MALPSVCSTGCMQRSAQKSAAAARGRACFALVVISAAALKILPAMTSKSDSAANEAADNSSAMDDAAGGAANDGYSYTYAAVQKDSALADEDFLYEGVPEDSTADRSADADSDYTVITLDLPEAADFLREHGMAVYTEAEDTSSCRRPHTS